MKVGGGFHSHGAGLPNRLREDFMDLTRASSIPCRGPIGHYAGRPRVRRHAWAAALTSVRPAAAVQTRRARIHSVWFCLALVMSACAHGNFPATTAEEQFANPMDPPYSTEILRARAERVWAVERWRRSLDALNQMIELRHSARVSRDRNGNVVSINDDSDLQRWRLDIETELLRAEGALSRLERKVKADFHGEYPPWWPRDNS